MDDDDSLHVRRLRSGKTLNNPVNTLTRERLRARSRREEKVETGSVLDDDSEDSEDSIEDTDGEKDLTDKDYRNFEVLESADFKQLYPDLNDDLDQCSKNRRKSPPRLEKKPVAGTEKEKKPTESSNFPVYRALLMITVLVIGAFLIIQSNKSTDPVEEKLSRWDRSLSEIVNKYGIAIPEISQRVINKSVRSVLQRRTPSKQFNNCEPSVILIIGSKYNAQAVKCISSGLSQSIAEVFNETKAPILQAENLSKLDITNQFNDILGHKELHTIILDGIERLNGLDALSLHTITDHDKAPYLDAIILLIAYTDARLTNSSLQIQQIDNIANSLLEYSWGNKLPEEQIAGLLSRLTPSVAIILDTVESQDWLCE